MPPTRCAAKTKGTALQSPAEIAQAIEASPDPAVETGPPDEVFVRAIDLPTPSLRQAQAAVAQQLDILSPLPPAEVAFSVVLQGPAEGGQNRFAVGIAPRARLWAGDQRDAGAVTRIGRLDGQVIVFRFERGGGGRRAPSPGARLEAATIAGACLALLLAGANLRVDREIDRLQTRADAAGQLVQARSAEAAAVARVASAWRAAAQARKAEAIDCAFGDLARAAGGPVKLSALTFSSGDLSLRLAAPLGDAGVTALRALGFTPAIAPPIDPTAAPPPVLDFKVGAGECR